MEDTREEAKRDGPFKPFKCAYVMVIMATFWVTEAIPLAITSLLPVALFPMLGTISTTRR